MKILLDECIPPKLKFSLRDNECQTVPESGFAGKKNGTLLGLAENAGFEVFVTMDKGLEYGKTLGGGSIAILILRAKSNPPADLLPLVPALLRSMDLASKFENHRITAPAPP